MKSILYLIGVFIGTMAVIVSIFYTGMHSLHIAFGSTMRDWYKVLYMCVPASLFAMFTAGILFITNGVKK